MSKGKHGEGDLHSVPLSLVIGRLYEADAVKAYNLPGVADDDDDTELADLGAGAVLRARRYAEVNDARIVQQGEQQRCGKWYWANDRSEGLGVERFGEWDVGGEGL